MNPLTLVKRIQSINAKEATLGISEDASWHVKYKDSAYVFVGGIPFDLTEGDLLAVFAQYGEIVDVNLVRDKGTGKSKGFAFVAYEDQRSTILAVDNLNGAQIMGRTIRVDHVSNYKKKEEEDEETARQKREARGVCRAFQKGECTRGDGCKFSHDEQRASNTGWGPEDHRNARWGNDKFEDSAKNERRSAGTLKPAGQGGFRSPVKKEYSKTSEKVAGSFTVKGNEERTEKHQKRSELRSREQDRRGSEKQESSCHREDWDGRRTDRKSSRDEDERDPREYHERRDEKRARKHESESYKREDRDGGSGRDKRESRDKDPSSYHYSGSRDKEQRRSSHSRR